MVKELKEKNIYMIIVGIKYMKVNLKKEIDGKEN